MGCGCGGSKWVPPTEAKAPRQRIVTDPNDPGNFWTGPEQPPAPAPEPAVAAPAEG
jgi:hypothetical protein